MKECVICKQEIFENIDRWVRLTDFNCGEQEGEVYNHLNCWKERFKTTTLKRKNKMYNKTMNSIKGKIKKLKGVEQ